MLCQFYWQVFLRNSIDRSFSLWSKLISCSTSDNVGGFGLWRRPVAHSLGVGEVGGSNPLSPTIFVYSQLKQTHIRNLALFTGHQPTRFGAAAIIFSSSVL